MSANNRWARVEALYHAASERSGEERAAFLDAACENDADLRREVESLLAQPASAEGFLAGSPLAAAAQMMSNPARSMLTGRRIGAYQLQRLVGAGGMGEVYSARDTKLDRDVAIKVLPRAFTTDAERLARFAREARVLAALNHPNIATIHGIEDSGGVRALVMELVEGPTLAELVERGAIPVAQVLPIARQVAEALEAAHEHGVIHRDLKPANIKPRPDGTIKVLDFGLAKIADLSSTQGTISHSPTITSSAMTGSGVILGTAAYLSPEQATGKPVDARADIWALGCVLYEMLTGRAAFAQDTIAETLAKIIDREPDWEALPAATSSSVRRLLRRCLEKDLRHRLHAAADVRIAIDDAVAVDEIHGSAARWTLAKGIAVGAGLIVFAAIVVTVTLTWTTARRTAPSLQPLRLDVITAPTNDPGSFALSPDGRQLVFVALERATPQLWLRELDQADAQRLPGTEGASHPFWAPNNRSIGFFADGLLKRLDLTGGRPQVLAQARNPMGGTWSRDDVILYSTNTASPLMRVAATGGTPAAVTHLSSGELSHRFPAFLPDGRRFLFVALTRAPEGDGLYVASLDAPNVRHRLLATDVAATYAPPGYLLVVRESRLMAVPFDATVEKPSGDPIPLVESVAIDRQGRGAVSVSATGLIAYRVGRATSNATELVWFDRNGTARSTVSAQGYPTLTADGRHIAIVDGVRSNTDVWLIERRRGIPRQFTFGSGFDIQPVWSADGSQLVFSSNRNGVFDLFEKPVTFARDERLLLHTSDNKFPMDWSPDGNTLLFVNEDAVTGDDLWVLPFKDPQQAAPLLKGRYAESQGQFSPNGRWIAYRSNESGRWEIYLRPYPGPGSQQLVSKGGGIQPRWRRDGKELFYIGADSRLMAVPIELPLEDGKLSVGTPTPLLTARLAAPTNQQFGYAVDPDGQRFLMMHLIADQTTTTPITVVQNWTSVLPK